MTSAISDKNEYQPTKAEEKLLNALLCASNRLLTVTEICKVAKISRFAYYEAFKKSGFVDLLEQESRRLALRCAPQIMNAFVREAQRGSYQHGKVLLEMAGLYVPTENREIKHSGSIDAVLTIDQRIKRLLALVGHQQTGGD